MMAGGNMTGSERETGTERAERAAVAVVAVLEVVVPEI